MLPLLAVLFSQGLFAQAPSGYYDNASGKTETALRAALHDIIDGHTTISYQQIWNAFWSTDNKGNNVVWDMYSDGASYSYNYYNNDQCGTYEQEGDCFNREHSWPQSWFSNAATPTTDLHHIFPTDGFVNYQRSNFPFGEVSNATWTSQNGSKLGPCKSSLGYTGKVFEPIDEYKGDFARAIMYMSVRYYGEDSDWGSSGMTNKSDIKPWAITMLLNWSDNDPVSQKEIDRNEVVYGIQGNRNPFIDHPEYAHLIWEPGWSGTAYAITCATGLSHGSISAPNTAVAGTIVTLTATPNSGYELDTWTVTKTGDANTTITVSGNTFVMPNYAVTVSATFKVNNTLYNITQGSVSHGSFTTSASSAKSGTTITLTANPASGYDLYAWYVYKTDDINTHVSVTTSGNSGSFTMPAFDVTVLASFAQVSSSNYVKVASAPSDWSGEYLIVYEAGSKAFDGGLTTLDATNNTISVTISSNSIASTTTTDAAKFTIAKSGNNYTITSASGYYIGQTSNNNGMVTSQSQAYTNTISYNNTTNSADIVGSGSAYLRYNATSGQERFRYFKSSTYTQQQPIQLYKKNSSTASAPTHTIQFNGNNGNGMMGDQIVNEFVPTKLNANAFTRDDYAFDSWNTAADGTGTTYFDGATVTLLNDLTLYAQWQQLYNVTLADVGNGNSISASHSQAVEGDIVTLTATPATGYEFDCWNVTAGGQPVSVSDNSFEMPANDVTVSATFTAVAAFAQQYYKVTDVGQLVAGRTYLIVNTVAGQALSTTQNNNNRAGVGVSISNGVIASIGSTVCELTLDGQSDAWTFFDPNWGDNGGYLYAVSSSDNHLKTRANNSDANSQWSISFDNNGMATIVAQGDKTKNNLRYNPNSGNPIFSCYASTSNMAKVELFIRSKENNYSESTTLTCLNTFDKSIIQSGVTLTANKVMGTTMCNQPENLVLEDGAQLIHHTDGVQATVKKTIETYTADDNGWYTIATPFASYTPAGMMIEDNFDLYAYDEDADKEWRNYKANTFNLASGTGYLYAHNPTVTLRMTGTLNNGDTEQDVPLSYGNAAEAVRGFNLLGNPTAHDISFTKTDNVSDGYYYLDNSENWVYTTSSTVPVGRGFVVKANAANQSVTLNPQSKGDGTDQGQYLCLSVGEEKSYVKLNEGVSMPLIDLKGQHVALYLMRDHRPYAMLVRDGAAALDLCFEAPYSGEFALSVDTQGLELDYLHFVDHLTGADIDLLLAPETLIAGLPPLEGVPEGRGSKDPQSLTPAYTFTASPSDYPNRFQLVFSPSASEPVEGTDCFAYVSNGQIILTGLDDDAATLQVIDATGRVLRCGDASNASTISTAGMAPGVYVLRLITADAVRVQRVVIR